MASHNPGFIKQRTWRLVGGAAIALAAAMAWYGSDHISREMPVALFAAYWIVFFVLFLVAMYMVLLDLRYIRLQYVTAQRDLFLDAVAEERLRVAIEQAKAESGEAPEEHEETKQG